MKMNQLVKEYRRLLKRHGPQGWWPLLSMAGKPGFDSKGYHPGSYEWPKSEEQRLEIAVGAVLTQNTSWKNAEKALFSLLDSNLLSLKALLAVKEQRLAGIIRTAGYYNQKARKIRALAEFLSKNRKVTRQALLGVWGIGPETADSILLYAYNRPKFVVDAYTVRFLKERGIIDKGSRMGYEKVQSLFEKSLPKSVPLYQEYHALIVREMKPQRRNAT